MYLGPPTVFRCHLLSGNPDVPVVVPKRARALNSVRSATRIDGLIYKHLINSLWRTEIGYCLPRGI